MTASEYLPVTLGTDPDQDAWFTAFFLENHIDPFAYPTKVCTLEQVEFMIFPENNERFFPCSDRMFSAIMSRKSGRFVLARYREVYDKIIRLVDEFIE